MPDDSVWIWPRNRGWQKSSHSDGAGNSIEVRARRADIEGNNRRSVLLARAGDGVSIRGSGDPDGPQLRVTPAEMTAFILGVKYGEFDDLLNNMDEV